MRVNFKKILATPSNFSIKKEGVEFNGRFKKLSYDMVEIELNLKGSLKHECDGCLDDFILNIDETSKLLVSDGVYSGDEIDVIESFDSFVDFDKICESELESIKSDYHYCKECEKNFKE